MTSEQADVLADVFNMLVGQGKPSAYAHENERWEGDEGTWSVCIRTQTERYELIQDAACFSRSLKEWMDP